MMYIQPRNWQPHVQGALVTHMLKHTDHSYIHIYIHSFVTTRKYTALLQ